MDPRLLREVEELHAVFTGWFRGEIPPEAFRRVERALAPGFRLIPPDGGLQERLPLLDALRAGRGSRPDLTIAVRPRDSRPLDRGLHLVLYEEWQTEAGRTHGRLSTALLSDDPTGFLWHHVHETRLPD